MRDNVVRSVRFAVGVWATVVVLLVVLVMTAPAPVARTPRMTAEVRQAYRYAAWCGGVVQVEPLYGGGHVVVVVGCDK